MLQLLLTLLIIATVFAVMVVFGGRLIMDHVTSALSRRHHELELILNTGLAPSTWTHRFQRRLRLLSRAGLDSSAVDRVKRWYKGRLERRLSRLLHQIEGSNVITDPEIKRAMASTIRHVGRTWEESSWEDVVPQDDDAS